MRDAPYRSDHTAIVVDGTNIYFTTLEYQCKKDGSATKKRVCVRQVKIIDWVNKVNNKK